MCPCINWKQENNSGVRKMFDFLFILKGGKHKICSALLKR